MGMKPTQGVVREARTQGNPAKLCLNGNHSADSLAELCSVSTVQAGPPHTGMEPLEQDFPDRNSRSSSAVPDSSLEWNSQIDFIEELLLDQLEPPELPEAEPQDEEDGGMSLCICGPVVPALDHAEVPPADLVPPPPAAPSAALAPQQEPAPGSPAPPAAELELLAPQQGSSLELHLRSALDPHLPFPCLTDLVIIVLIAALTSRRQVND
ncbi:hypothetical protein H920_02659 [Fukomys damarensis]|uniref:Uncharacterized protein n=1 Tax=Fukomys damarensis TaxID=885580 RepID=A0A091DXW8_FUKDA|nr:hypothetical protein H920_02659 [Fukomys damarensis]